MSRIFLKNKVTCIRLSKLCVLWFNSLLINAHSRIRVYVPSHIAVVVNIYRAQVSEEKKALHLASLGSAFTHLWMKHSLLSESQNCKSPLGLLNIFVHRVWNRKSTLSSLYFTLNEVFDNSASVDVAGNILALTDFYSAAFMQCWCAVHSVLRLIIIFTFPLLEHKLNCILKISRTVNHKILSHLQTTFFSFKLSILWFANFSSEYISCIFR